MFEETGKILFTSLQKPPSGFLRVVNCNPPFAIFTQAALEVVIGTCFFIWVFSVTYRACSVKEREFHFPLFWPQRKKRSPVALVSISFGSPKMSRSRGAARNGFHLSAAVGSCFSRPSLTRVPADTHGTANVRTGFRGVQIKIR